MLKLQEKNVKKERRKTVFFNNRESKQCVEGWRGCIERECEREKEKNESAKVLIKQNETRRDKKEGIRRDNLSQAKTRQDKTITRKDDDKTKDKKKKKGGCSARPSLSYRLFSDWSFSNFKFPSRTPHFPFSRLHTWSYLTLLFVVC